MLLKILAGLVFLIAVIWCLYVGRFEMAFLFGLLALALISDSLKKIFFKHPRGLELGIEWKEINELAKRTENIEDKEEITDSDKEKLKRLAELLLAKAKHIETNLLKGQAGKVYKTATELGEELRADFPEELQVPIKLNPELGDILAEIDIAEKAFESAQQIIQDAEDEYGKDVENQSTDDFHTSFWGKRWDMINFGLNNCKKAFMQARYQMRIKVFYLNYQLAVLSGNLEDADAQEIKLRNCVKEYIRYAKTETFWD